MSIERSTPARRRDYDQIDVRPSSSALGATIGGVDLRQPLAEAVIAELRRAFLEYLVIFLPGQQLSPSQQLAFTSYFGEPLQYPQLKGLPECPLVTRVVKRAHEKVNFGGVWHTDTSYLPCPPMASSLYAVQIPPRGGDTWFANQYLAYEALDEGLRRRLEGLRAVNSSAKAAVARTREDRLREDGLEMQVFESVHPVVRTHPETGRRALYVNAGHTTRLEGVSAAESERLLQLLFAHQIGDEFTFRHSWQVGCLALWDNRSTQHYPVNDYDGYRRVMHRVTLRGDVPV